MTFINIESYYYFDDGTPIYVCINTDGSIKHVRYSDLIKAIRASGKDDFNVVVDENGEITRSSGEAIKLRDSMDICDTIFTDKFSMTIEQNVFVAKRNIVDYIWKSAKLEGIAVTYPDTEAIYNGLVVSGMNVDDIQAINNLKHAWRFILETIEYTTDYPFVCEINRRVGSNLFHNPGLIRTVPVSIGGTTWRPDMPIESQIKKELAKIFTLKGKTDKAITLMLHLMRKQMFLDGNKRTSMLAGNHVMISGGTGIISVPIEKQVAFTELLVKYYETNEMAEIKEFVYDNCIDGIAFT